MVPILISINYVLQQLYKDYGHSFQMASVSLSMVALWGYRGRLSQGIEMGLLRASTVVIGELGYCGARDRPAVPKTGLSPPGVVIMTVVAAVVHPVTSRALCTSKAAQALAKLARASKECLEVFFVTGTEGEGDAGDDPDAEPQGNSPHTQQARQANDEGSWRGWIPPSPSPSSTALNSTTGAVGTHEAGPGPREPAHEAELPEGPQGWYCRGQQCISWAAILGMPHTSPPPAKRRWRRP